MKKIVVGILAHVDAGKTTLSEAMLFASGKIKKLGRVDHRDTYLDTHALERMRGITIFSKQAEFSVGDTEITLLDTPGHVDFSAETERTLGVLDYAVLVISGTDGVQAHTETLWRLLRRYHVPTYIFVTKTDLMIADRSTRIDEIKKKLSSCCVDFTDAPDEEEIALCDEEVLSTYLQSDTVETETICDMIRDEKLFPCYFGSGLKLSGIEDFLRGLDTYTKMPVYGDDFSAVIYKIGRDDQGNRLTYMKIIGGTLKVRAPITYHSKKKGTEIEEKVNQIRIYSGSRYSVVEEALPGTVCAVLGFSETIPGMTLGTASHSYTPVLEAVLNYRIVLPEDIDAASFLPKMRLLEEEDPELHVYWDEKLREIHVRLMGAVQIEILKSIVEDRFGVTIDIVDGRILYKETIADAVVGIGHFEPLRHYAEAHLLLEPLEAGSGIVLDTKCDTDLLDRNWQRLILGQLESYAPIGVLAGAPLTDIKITLVAGRAHNKHTEGGDFRQAAIRALRQGLMQAKSVLLEPYYEFTLALPAEYLGRGIRDIQT
ncbi:MAG: TetM/TetW/TetO/TetS family tetracycline resistance ribosomal protection protein, partial [Firmicutes bacterium]|nr:TetM/TetW/TetO/TetS family tetracycline resistance ribosomal protection protein [Bacillota bacterium]